MSLKSLITIGFLFLIGFVSCKKSRACVKKNSVEFSKVDEQNIEYEIYENNGAEVLVPKWFSPNGDGVNDQFF